mmetsp:Transcript_31864/g.87241  ORF Transcript_31864/g.87241 Transcript_31864/m.87241 type:complete len:300 (+) Transcript_31864:882-1781(+)
MCCSSLPSGSTTSSSGRFSCVHSTGPPRPPCLLARPTPTAPWSMPSSPLSSETRPRHPRARVPYPFSERSHRHRPSWAACTPLTSNWHCRTPPDCFSRCRGPTLLTLPPILQASGRSVPMVLLLARRPWLLRARQRRPRPRSACGRRSSLCSSASLTAARPRRRSGRCTRLRAHCSINSPRMTHHQSTDRSTGSRRSYSRRLRHSCAHSERQSQSASTSSCVTVHAPKRLGRSMARCAASPAYTTRWAPMACSTWRRPFHSSQSSWRMQRPRCVPRRWSSCGLSRHYRRRDSTCEGFDM